LLPQANLSRQAFHIWIYEVKQTDPIPRSGLDEEMVQELIKQGRKNEIRGNRHAEEVPQGSKGPYWFLFERNPQPMWVYDVQTLTFLEVNQASVKQYGYSRNEFLHLTIRDIVPAEDLPALHESISRRVVGLEEPGTWRHRKKNGTLIDVEITSHSLDWAGRPARVVSALDITARKRAEEGLRQSEESYRQLVEQSPDAMLVHRQGAIIFANYACAELFGASSPGELLGKQHLDFVHPDDREAVKQRIQKFSYDLESVRRNETRFLRLDGTETCAEVMARSVIYQGGAAIQVMFRDVSERKRAEEALAEHARELARSNAELEQFAYVASHDLQEPLRMVASYTQLLARRYQDKLDADARDFIAYAVDGATRMQALIADLLNYSRIGTRGKPFRPSSCEAVLERVLASLKLATNESGATVSHDSLPTVLGDDVQLGQLFQNLLVNAIKFRTEAPPRIHLSAERNGNVWTFSVRDNGIGIAPEYAERIFMIFQRLHSKNEYPGTGIGLAVCKKIVERHGGRIWVNSQPGSGATFFFTIPDRDIASQEEQELR
jgi:PAS domain S-box-containing protein